ncbi:MAG: cytidylate kinase [Candidatus Parvarchaeum acidophilus ARMAN-5]|jgi:cytidylate kinase|uniref:Cytidylate kinase n=1 Tax=Candidatus Parvarchaeum acidophilus ARMAN-5 TaxID=662762 RepID=D6GUV5_PARA5|nr:MAG: cytidylate kinase [Candidatus Parvarchaeum acidophilus ARMAN-5]
MKVIVSGLTASGKSSVSKALAKEFNLEYFSASSKLREILPKKDFEVWESKKGIEAVKFRIKNPIYDKKLDRIMLSLFNRSFNMILDSWVASWKVTDTNIIKIYIKADEKIRAERVSNRDGITFKQALSFMRIKDKLTAQIYSNIYGIDVKKDFRPFNLVIDSSYLDLKEVIKICSYFILKCKKAKF